MAEPRGHGVCCWQLHIIWLNMAQQLPGMHPALVEAMVHHASSHGESYSAVPAGSALWPLPTTYAMMQCISGLLQPLLISLGHSCALLPVALLRSNNRTPPWLPPAQLI